MTRAVNRLVKYAFEEKKARKVFAKVHPDNSASMAVLERAGFTKANQLKDGEVFYSICRLTTDC